MGIGVALALWSLILGNEAIIRWTSQCFSLSSNNQVCGNLAGEIGKYVVPFLVSGALIGLGLVLAALGWTASVRLREEWRDQLDYVRIAVLVAAFLLALFVVLGGVRSSTCGTEKWWEGPPPSCAGPPAMPVWPFFALAVVGVMAGFYLVSWFWMRPDGLASDELPLSNRE